MPREGHFINRSNALRAAMLGANDGVVSISSLMIGVTAAGLTRGDILLTGLAGLAAGGLSMAAGEYISVSTQWDVEQADLERERVALIDDPEYELDELTEGLEARGVEADLAREVAQQMTDHDALGAHAREELGIFGVEGQADPQQAAIFSGVAFALGAGLPLMAAVVSPVDVAGPVIAAIAIATLALSGAVGASLGGTPIAPAVRRVVLLGGAAMLLTWGIGSAFNFTH
ncbi:VIT1/CCC1 family predicted Fe2+/Mn2+ transporter [Sulfitobacter undariae]|uniref:VIT1/CCC1 family predicted Fe2+/Mn2+ transporter n=1 Tax=Sulfitobacter undariae TaxID=1563671 RepID=A0A7W6E826_9RHOB|nr:VIT family protein [Sulfitobacter undariae]MBB3993478.1 VIT1/CCC1 family predicted Fe2+/Mn2+ transporter [Sulfitobacter undariae]